MMTTVTNAREARSDVTANTVGSLGRTTNALGDDPTPEVAVVVPTYRRVGLLARMVAALEVQTLSAERFEVVVVDNGSDDDTFDTLVALAARSRLRLRPLRIDVNRGPAQARNLGWRSSRAPIVAFIDDDCVPDPEWLATGLAAIGGDDGVGVLQGRTRRPDHVPLGDWTIWREVRGISPFFEGCNIFYRRAALETAGGFDEGIGWYGEDTALGWAVLEQGWRRDFAGDATVAHDVVERGLGWQIRHAFLEANLAGVAARYPDFGHLGFWRPWAFRKHNAAFALALAGLVLSVWKRPAAALVVPYARLRLPPRGHQRFLRLAAERLAVDAAVFAGMKVASVRHRRVFL